VEKISREIGDIVEFSNGRYQVVEDNIVPDKKRNNVLLLLNGLAIVLMFVTGSLMVVLNGFIHDEFSYDLELFTLLAYMIGLLVVFFGYVVIHELLHGWAFRLFNGNKKNQLKFGVILKNGMAYCISTVPVNVKAARLSLMMPVYVVCLPLMILSVVLGNLGLVILSAALISGSAGDFYYMWKLRKTSEEYYMFEEMPTKEGYEIGYILYKKID